VNGFPPFLLFGDMWQNILIMFSIPFVCAVILTPLFRFIAHQTGTLDIPNGSLKRHSQATAYLGGVAIYVTLCFSYVVFEMFFHSSLYIVPRVDYFLGVTFLLLIGLIDDIFTISPLKKLIGQVGACLFFLKAGFYFKAPLVTKFLPHFLCFPEMIVGVGLFLSLWWVVSIINAINLLDIMDGLATTVSFMAVGGFALYNGSFDDGILLIPLLGALSGFFLYNRPRASIYLGDAGSLMLGGIVSTLPFVFGWGNTPEWGEIFAPLIILGIPIIELCWLMGVRISLGIPFYHGSPHHFALYLKKWGWSVKKILRVTGAMGGISSFIAYCVAFGGGNLFPIAGISFLGAFFLLFVCL
jgi:UDP-GlcNAc:undecaprenyl-phosphate GlcNAc-1-phosphate transferase